jgi:hypothetical protein
MNAGLASSWHTPEIPTDEDGDPQDAAAFFRGDPLAAPPAEYTARVDDGLRRQGFWPARRAGEMQWFADLCREAGLAAHADAIQARAHELARPR